MKYNQQSQPEGELTIEQRKQYDRLLDILNDFDHPLYTSAINAYANGDETATEHGMGSDQDSCNFFTLKTAECEYPELWDAIKG